MKYITKGPDYMTCSHDDSTVEMEGHFEIHIPDHICAISRSLLNATCVTGQPITLSYPVDVTIHNPDWFYSIFPEGKPMYRLVITEHIQRTTIYRLDISYGPEPWDTVASVHLLQLRLLVPVVT